MNYQLKMSAFHPIGRKYLIKPGKLAVRVHRRLKPIRSGKNFAAVEALKTVPIHLDVTRTYDEQGVRDAVLALTKTLDLQPVNAVVTGFELASKEFIITDATPGRIIDGEACATEVLKLYKAGQSGQTVVCDISDPLPLNLDQAALKAKLGRVSEAVTLANKVNTPRDSNIKLVCKMINGLVLQPGETFSFKRLHRPENSRKRLS